MEAWSIQLGGNIVFKNIQLRSRVINNKVTQIPGKNEPYYVLGYLFVDELVKLYS